MKTIQNPISDNHHSAMFFHGVVATGEKDGKNYTLKTFQDGELEFDGDLYIGDTIRELGKTGKINDDDVEEEITVGILVDKFFAITEEGVEVDVDENDHIYNYYNDAMKAFENFLNG